MKHYWNFLLFFWEPVRTLGSKGWPAGRYSPSTTLFRDLGRSFSFSDLDVLLCIEGWPCRPSGFVARTTCVSSQHTAGRCSQRRAKLLPKYSWWLKIYIMNINYGSVTAFYFQIIKKAVSAVISTSWLYCLGSLLLPRQCQFLTPCASMKGPEGTPQSKAPDSCDGTSKVLGPILKHRSSGNLVKPSYEHESGSTIL